MVREKEGSSERWVGGGGVSRLWRREDRDRDGLPGLPYPSQTFVLSC